MKCWCFLRHFCLFAFQFQTVVFATSTVPFLNEVFFFFSLRKNQLAFCALARRKSWICCVLFVRVRACVRVCIYFKRAKAKRIIAWRRSFLFVSKRQATETHFFSHEGKTQTSQIPNRNLSSETEVRPVTERTKGTHTQFCYEHTTRVHASNNTLQTQRYRRLRRVRFASVDT